MRQLKGTHRILFFLVFVCCSFRGFGQIEATHTFNCHYSGSNLDRVAFRVGGSDPECQDEESSHGRS